MILVEAFPEAGLLVDGEVVVVGGLHTFLLADGGAVDEHLLEGGLEGFAGMGVVMGVRHSITNNL